MPPTRRRSIRGSRARNLAASGGVSKLEQLRQLAIQLGEPLEVPGRQRRIRLRREVPGLAPAPSNVVSAGSAGADSMLRSAASAVAPSLGGSPATGKHAATGARRRSIAWANCACTASSSPPAGQSRSTPGLVFRGARTSGGRGSRRGGGRHKRAGGPAGVTVPVSSAAKRRSVAAADSNPCAGPAVRRSPPSASGAISANGVGRPWGPASESRSRGAPARLPRAGRRRAIR